MSRIHTHLKAQSNVVYKANRGFTIVELIVVVVIMGILAAVVLISYGNWRTRVARAEVESDLLNIQASMEEARNRSNGYPTFTAGTVFNGTNSTEILFTQSEHVTITYESGNATAYCITAVSEEESSVSMYVDSAFAAKPIDGSC